MMEKPTPMMNAYGCVRCQETHYEDEPIFREHLLCQSKHGMRKVLMAEVEQVRQNKSRPSTTPNGTGRNNLK